MSAWWKIISLTILSLGLVALITGGIFFGFYDVMKTNIIAENTILRPDSEAFRRWSNDSSSTYRRIYVFEVINPDDVSTRAAKPIVAERGPYTFRVRDRRSDEKFNDDSVAVGQFEQVSYRLERRLDFIREQSTGTLSDRVTVINAAAVTLATWARHGSADNQTALAVTLTEIEKLFRTMTIAQLVYGFYEDSWDVVRGFMADSFNVTLAYDSYFAGLLNDVRPPTEDHTVNFTIWTGASDESRVRQISSFNGDSSLFFWKSEQSNAINGTDGNGWPPYVRKSTTIDVFDQLWCRSIRLTRKTNRSTPSDNATSVQAADDGNVDKNVDHFVQSDEVYDNTGYEHGFCTGDGDEYCLPRGVLNVSKCRDDYPFVWSEPHFYQSDYRYADAIDGLNPTEMPHQTVVNVEPLTGRVVTSSRKLQMNVYVRHLVGYPPTKNLINGVIFPVIWMAEDKAMSQSEKAWLQDDVIGRYERYSGLQNIMELMMVLGAMFAAIGLVSLIIMLYNSERQLALVLMKNEEVPLLRDAEETAMTS